MVVEVSVYLFEKPNWEMGIEGGNATPKMLREKADELRDRLRRAADILEKLDGRGWDLAEAYGSVYSLDFTKDVSLEEAERELEELGIGLDEVSVRDLELDEE